MGWSNSSVFQVVIITGAAGSGLFVYSPVQGNGNLVGSIAAAAGTDHFGNAYLPGITSYLPGVPNTAFAELFNATLILGTKAGLALNAQVEAITRGLLLNAEQLLGTDVPAQLQLNAAALGGQATVQVLSPAQLQALAGLTVTGGETADQITVSNSGAPANPLIQATNLTAAGSALMRVQLPAVAGVLQAFGVLVAGDANNRLILDIDANGNPRFRAGPGSAGTDTLIYRGGAALWASSPVAFNNAGIAEVWNAPAFVNGWANTALNVPLQYRRVAAPDNCVQIIGAITAPAGIVAGQNIIAALPAGYRPATVQPINCFNATGPKACNVLMTVGGQLQFQAGAVAGDVIEIPGGNLIALTA